MSKRIGVRVMSDQLRGRDFPSRKHITKLCRDRQERCPVSWKH